MKNSMVYAVLASICLQAHAICIHNKSGSTLYYEIHNKNTGCSKPKVIYYEGYLQPLEKRCYAHDESDNDWKIFRHDLINIFKISHDGKKQAICNKSVLGILNTLEVDYHDFSDKWWCLDRSDYDD